LYEADLSTAITTPQSSRTHLIVQDAVPISLATLSLVSHFGLCCRTRVARGEAREASCLCCEFSPRHFLHYCLLTEVAKMSLDGFWHWCLQSGRPKVHMHECKVPAQCHCMRGHQLHDSRSVEYVNVRIFGAETDEYAGTKNISLRNCGAPIRNRGKKYVVLSNAMVSIGKSTFHVTNERD
jgi:hypothetical protein